MDGRLPCRSWLLLPLAVACGLALLLLDPLPLQVLRNDVFDQYQRWQPRTAQAPAVRIVDVDEQSLQRLGQWPWPRDRLARLVDELQSAQVAAIGFDMVFAEADRTSPHTLAVQWPLDDALRDALRRLPDPDQVFARSIARAPVVVGFTLDRRPAGQAPAGLSARPFRYIESGGTATRWLHAFDAATASLAPLETAAQGNGALSFVADSDGVVRRVPLVLALAGQPVSTLTAEMLRVAQRTRNVVLQATPDGASGLAGVGIGRFSVPTNANGEMWVHYSAAKSERSIPAWQVLAGEVPREQLAGRLVLVGSSAQGLMDLRFSPLGRIVPGVEVHAQALEQILSGHYLRRPAWATAAEAIVIAIGALLCAVVALRCRALPAALTGAVLVGGVMGAGWIAFLHYGLLLDSVTPALVLLATFVVGSLLHHLSSEQRQRWIKAAFSRYVSPNLVAYLVDHPDDLALGGHRQQCSFVFTDLAGFTSLMEKTDPANAVALLNDYLDAMIHIAFAHDGTLDRIVGDAVAIMFSAPVRQADHRQRALACALEMDRFARQYADALRAKGVDFGKTRIGIHSGEVIVGNFGGSTIFDYRALGDAVNTAARLEGANKTLGTTICLSQETLAGCAKNTPTRPIGRLLLKGKQNALMVHEPLTSPDAGCYAPYDAYCAAYEQMERDEQDSQPTAVEPTALALFEALAQRFPDDPLPALHARRLREGARGNLIILSEKH